MRKKVVVIDDEPFILMMIEDKLSRAGMDVVTTKESKGALDLIRRERPDLVILDWMLPEISGLEVCREIREDDDVSSIPVIMLSAKGQAEDLERGMALGVEKYITKPFSPKALLEDVISIIGK